MSENSKAESRSKDQNMFPEKPNTETGFRKAVAWFGGRELVASLKDTLMYSVYGENIDPRSWMKANIYPDTIEKEINKKEIEELEKRERKIDLQTSDDKKSVEAGNSDLPESAVSNNDEKLFSVMSAEVSKSLKKDENVKINPSDISKQDWAKKIHDQWEWKKNTYEHWEAISKDEKFWKQLQPDNQDLKEFWFDYIADTGDGQLGVYNVACMCLSDLWVDMVDEDNPPEKRIRFKPPKVTDLSDKIILPRGAFLFVGGDTAYHSSNYATLVERFQHPFRWAFTSVRNFAETNYRLKSGIKISTEQTVQSATDPKDKLSGSLEQPAGTLPGKINSIEYTDTEPTRPLFGIPANHDYYDGIDGFNRLFRHPPFDIEEENIVFKNKRGKLLLQIPTFSRKQEASYIAISLPFDWWMYGIDSENEKLDFRQEIYFTELVERYEPKKLIIATPEPTTVFGKKCDPEDKTATYIKTITEGLGLNQPFLTDGKFTPLKTQNQNKPDDEEEKKPDLSGDFCRLDLSGDIHHYARYWGEDTRNFKEDTQKFHSDNYASIVAGGGGAFFDVTKTLIGKPLNRLKNPIFKDRKIDGEVPPQKIFPSSKKSVSKTADKLFDVWNIRSGGYVQYAGFAIAAILFYFLSYFSNFSKVLKDYKNNTLSANGSITENQYFISILLFAAVGVFIFVTALTVNKLIKTLKEKSFKNKLDENTDARMKQLAFRYIPFLFALPFYFFALTNIFHNRNQAANTDLDNFLISCNLIIIFIIFFLLLWLSSEHTNWLAVRFKITSKYKKKTLTQRVEDSNEPTDWKILKVIGFLSRLYSYQYFLSNVLVFAAFAFLISGISIFGRVSISRTLADAVLVLIFVGFFALITVVLGLKTGASYHRSVEYKIYFFVLGLWHYILQIATPLVLFYFGSWATLITAFLLIGLFSSSSFISTIIRTFIVGDNRKSEWEFIANFRLAALLTKHLNKFVLFFIWVLYGSVFLFLHKIIKTENTIYGSIQEFFQIYSKNFYGYNFLQRNLSEFYNVNTQIFDSQFAYYCTIWVSIIVIGYVGYLMSRVWLGWYLAVSMKFDGHNNEAGGAARIEGFKHLLRVKVEPELITVFVIGFETPRVEMKDLEMKLVDKFTLTPKPISEIKNGDSI